MDELIAGQVSLARLDHSTPAMLQQHLVDPLKKPGRTFCGIARAIVSVVRAINLPGICDQAFCIVDDEINGFAAHARLSFSDDAKRLDDNEQVALRTDLVDVFGDPVSLANLDLAG